MAVTWGSDTALTTQTAIDNATEEFIGTIDLAAALSAHIQLEIDNEAGSVTDAVIISVYATLDDTSEVFDDQAYMTFTILPSGSYVKQINFLQSGCSLYFSLSSINCLPSSLSFKPFLVFFTSMTIFSSFRRKSMREEPPA